MVSQKSFKMFFIFLLILFTSSFGLDNSIISSQNPDGKNKVSTLFEKWLVKHNKVYNGFHEKEKRFKIFEDNLKIIEEHNSNANQTYKLGLNNFSDLTFEEFSKIYLNSGLKENSFDDKLFNSSDRYLPNKNDDLPTHRDWRFRGAVTEVKNQNPCGACWIFSSIATIEAINKIKTGELISLSEQQVLDCERRYSKGCQGGTPEIAFQYILRNGGINTEEQYPYTGTQNQCDSYKALPKVVIIRGFEMVPRNNENALKKAVAYQVVNVRILIGRPFQQYKSGIILRECGDTVGHAVAAIGYGTTKDGIDYWILKNSWGPNWGNKGYVRIQRNAALDDGACKIATFPSYPILLTGLSQKQNGDVFTPAKASI